MPSENKLKGSYTLLLLEVKQHSQVSGISISLTCGHINIAVIFRGVSVRKRLFLKVYLSSVYEVWERARTCSVLSDRC